MLVFKNISYKLCYILFFSLFWIVLEYFSCTFLVNIMTVRQTDGVYDIYKAGFPGSGMSITYRIKLAVNSKPILKCRFVSMKSFKSISILKCALGPLRTRLCNWKKAVCILRYLKPDGRQTRKNVCFLSLLYLH